MDALFDESGKFHSGSVVAFCGVAGYTQALDRFNAAWGSLLTRNGLTFLSMKRALMSGKKLSDQIPAQSVEERTESLIPFAKAIREHLDLGVVMALDVQAYRKMPKAVRKAIGSVDDPVFAAFQRGVLKVIEHSKSTIGFVCDDEEQTAEPCYTLYRRLIKTNTTARKALGSLTFANDEFYPGLQAADMLASLARLEAGRRFFGCEHDYGRLFDVLNAKQTPGTMLMESGFWTTKTFEALANDGPWA